MFGPCFCTVLLTSALDFCLLLYAHYCLDTFLFLFLSSLCCLYVTCQYLCGRYLDRHATRRETALRDNTNNGREGDYNLGHKGWKFHFIRILPLPTPVQC